MFIIPSLDFRFGWSFVPTSISILGDAFVLLGLFIVFLVFKENSYTSAVIDIDKNQKVITTGPYHIVRHPMYSGAMIMLLGIPLALGSWWGLVACIPIFIVIVVRLLDEERFLISNLDGYKEYTHITHFHLIPYIW
jgi:protein-S-isoprenylcysteine O-methyltransferase Ste14